MSLKIISSAVLAAGILVSSPSQGAAQWVQENEQFYYPASHNWVFRRSYPMADRLFNAFDYGHAILYEKLLTKPNAPVSLLEEKEYNFITKKLLVNPPSLPLEEAAIEPTYVKYAPEAKLMFEWAHVLHRQVYDVLGDERLSDAQKDKEIAAILAYYKSRPDLAFSSYPKSMSLMEGQYYSLAFKEKYPKFNGLIWGYHWLQVGLYEPLLMGKTLEERQTGVAQTVTKFKRFLENPENNFPTVMPMTSAVAPAFTARYPEVAIIFDNLHSMHDVISDILVSPKVAKSQKRAEILKAAKMYRDSTSFITSVQEWKEMGEAMGLQNMGGHPLDTTPALPSKPAAGDHKGHVMPSPKKDVENQHTGHSPKSSTLKEAKAKEGTLKNPAPGHGNHD